VHTFIYTLTDPRDGLIRYVGKADNLKSRFQSHMKNENTRKCGWIKSLKKQGLKPIIEAIDIVPINEWQFWEQYWIQVTKSWGFDLYNGDNGGLGSTRFTNEVKQAFKACR